MIFNHTKLFFNSQYGLKFTANKYDRIYLLIFVSKNGKSGLQSNPLF